MHLSRIVLIHLYFFFITFSSAINYSCCGLLGLVSKDLICCYGFDVCKLISVLHFSILKKSSCKIKDTRLVLPFLAYTFLEF